MCVDYLTKDKCFHHTQHILSVIGMLLSVTNYQQMVKGDIVAGDRAGFKEPRVQATVLISSQRNVCLGSVCFYLKDRACEDDGAAMVAGARTCAACRIVHVWSNNSCLGHHHTGIAPRIYKLPPFISTTILMGEKVLLGLMHELLCYSIVPFVTLLLF